jgi:polyhydroxyalkanoate synthase
VKFNLAQGRTVFALSWANPTKEHCDFSMHDYLEAGINTAIATAYKINKENLRGSNIQGDNKNDGDAAVNVIAMCVGGTFFLTRLAEAYATDKPMPVGSVTLLMTPINFKCLEWFHLFVSEPFLPKQHMNWGNDGVLMGEVLTKMFCCLRANDLIWPNYVERYLLGNELSSLDFLYWNHDTPRIPLKMLSECINDFFFKNMFFSKETDRQASIVQEGLKKIKNQMFVFGTERDHVVPWESCFSATKILSNAKFVLGGAGHIAGCINPPHKNKYYYYENIVKKNQKAGDWLASANKKTGSWWTAWNTWQQQFDGTKMASYAPTSCIEEAPGSFATK